MSLNYDLVDAFYLICEEEGNTQTVENVRNAAFDKIKDGEGKSIVSASLNGKSFSYQVSDPATVIFAAASRAIRRYNRGVIVAVETDFSRI